MPDSSSSYCRDLEAYLCQKNDGHLVRIVGPSFDVVGAWLAEGIPFKVACAGIDRYFERYHKKAGARRRPVRIDFCDADVRDVFDEWRRATGLTTAAREAPAVAVKAEGAQERRGPSLPDHLERALMRLTNARATGAIGEAFDPILDAVSQALDAARGAQGGLRGDARKAMLMLLESYDRNLGTLAARAVDPDVVDAIRREVDEELASFRGQLPGDRYTQAAERSVDRLIRTRLGLPTLKFS